MSAEQPREQTLIRRAINSALLSVHTVMPGTVVSYDAAEQSATVQVGVRVLDNDEDAEGGPRLVDVPTLQDVPVCQLAGGGFLVNVPLAPGDPVLVLYCEQDPSIWLESGEVSDPPDITRHGLAGPVCIPGPRPATAFVEDASADELIVGKVGGLQVRIKDEVLIGTQSGSLDYVATDTLVKDALQALFDHIESAITEGQPAATPDGGAALKSSILAALSGYVPASVKCQKVQVE